MPPSRRSRLDEHRDGWLRCPARPAARATRARALSGLARSPPRPLEYLRPATPAHPYSARVMHELPAHSRTSPGHISSTNVRTVCRRDAVSWWSKRLRPRRTERWPVRASSLSLASARACPAAHCCAGPRSCWALLKRAFCVAAQASDCSGCSAASGRDAMARRLDSNYRHRSRARAALRRSQPAAADLAANAAYATHSPSSPPVSPRARARRELAARSPRARRALARALAYRTFRPPRVPLAKISLRKTTP